MSSCFLVQTEKAYNLQQQNVFTLSFEDKRFDINKIELTKKLTAKGLKVKKISVTNSYSKLKKRNGNKHPVSQLRRKKYFVILKEGSVINNDIINQLNEQPATA